MSHEQKIRENLSTLVDLTSNVEDILRSLKNKEIITEEEHDKIATAESPFDKKSQLYYLIAKKDEEAFNELINVLRATANDEAADKLIEKSPEVQVESAAVVTLESKQITQDDEGVALSEAIEKELDRIQSEQDDANVENSKEVEDESNEQVMMQTAAEVVEVFDKEMDEYALADAPTVKSDEPRVDSDGENNVESEVRVEITPAESEPEEIISKLDEELNGDVDEHEEEPRVEVQDDEEEEKVAVNNVVEEVVEEAPKKQVTFGAVSADTTAASDPKEIILNEPEEDESMSAMARKSLVQLNREKFEKSAPAGVKVKYNFKGPNGNEQVEEPKESTVKNLRNFFQKLGSVEKEEAVAKRQGAKMGGVHPNRRTMAL